MLRNSEHRPCFRMTGPFRNSLGRRPFLGAPSRLSSDRTGGPVISTLEEKDSYDVGGAKSDGHGGAESSCQKHQARLRARCNAVGPHRSSLRGALSMYPEEPNSK